MPVAERVGPHDHRHALGVLRQVNGGLAGRVGAADDAARARPSSPAPRLPPRRRRRPRRRAPRARGTPSRRHRTPVAITTDRATISFPSPVRDQGPVAASRERGDLVHEDEVGAEEPRLLAGAHGEHPAADAVRETPGSCGSGARPRLAARRTPARAPPSRALPTRRRSPPRARPGRHRSPRRRARSTSMRVFVPNASKISAFDGSTSTRPVVAGSRSGAGFRPAGPRPAAAGPRRSRRGRSGTEARSAAAGPRSSDGARGRCRRRPGTTRTCGRRAFAQSARNSLIAG